MKKDRVITYIDGFNLYFGLKDRNWKRYYWLNLQALSLNLLIPGQLLALTKYFTTRVSNSPSKVKRQGTYIEALETLDNFRIFYGHYMPNVRTCPRCLCIHSVPKEKSTDVNIAVEMLTDAFEDKYDIALLISADSDLVGAVKSILRLTDKKVVVAFPPERFSSELSSVASASFTIGRRKLAQSMFPDKVTKTNGFILEKPERWQ